MWTRAHQLLPRNCLGVTAVAAISFPVAIMPFWLKSLVPGSGKGTNSAFHVWSLCLRGLFWWGRYLGFAACSKASSSKPLSAVSQVWAVSYQGAPQPRSCFTAYRLCFENAYSIGFHRQDRQRNASFPDPTEEQHWSLAGAPLWHKEKCIILLIPAKPCSLPVFIPQQWRTAGQGVFALLWKGWHVPCIWGGLV